MLSLTLFEVVKDLVILVVGGGAGYWIAAHNRKANKEQVEAIEDKIAELQKRMKAGIKTS